MRMIRILVVQPTRIVSSLYASVLDDRPNMQVVAQVTAIDDALRLVESSRCNIVLVSAGFPDNGALELTRTISRQHPNVKVMVVGLPESRHAILQYVMAGASGYVLQDVTVDRLIENIQAAQEDKALVSPTIAAALMEHVAELAQVSAQPYLNPDAYAALTPRELEILQLIGDGLTNQEIADRLVIEVGTVKNHVHSILSKLDVSSREDAAVHLPFILGGNEDSSDE